MKKQPESKRAGKAKKLTRWAVVRFQIAGFHCWPNAPMARGYLRERHRHLFHVEVQLEVSHNEREVEFHDLLSWSRTQFENIGSPIDEVEFQGQSCETMAEQILEKIARQFGNRRAKVSVFEDGECGAILEQD